MTTLVVDELKTELSQDVNYNNEDRALIASVMPYIFMYNAPVGTFIFSIFKGVEELYSKSFTSADIKTALNTTNNYAHVFFPIVPEGQICLENGLYTFKLQSTGYTFSESSYLGWIRQHEDLQLPLDYVPVDDFSNPLSLRIKIYKEYK